MDLRDLSSLNQEFRSLRLLGGDLSRAPAFRHYSLWRQDVPRWQPGDCIVAIEAQLPRDEAAFLALLDDPALSSAAGVIVRAAEAYALPSGFGGILPILALPLSTDLDRIVLSLQTALQGPGAYLDYIHSCFEEDLSRLSGDGAGACASLLALLRFYLGTPVLLFSDQYVLRQPCSDEQLCEGVRALWRARGSAVPFQDVFVGLTCCFHPVTDSRTAIASLCTVYPEGAAPTEADEMLVSALLPRLSLHILRGTKTDRLYHRDPERFLRAVLSGDFGADGALLQKNAEFLGIDYRQQRLLFCVELLPESALADRTFARRISDYFSALHCRFFSLQVGACLIYITECDTLQSTLSAFHRSVLPQMASLSNNTGVRLCAGVSSEFTDLWDLPRALSEAEFSQKIGKKLNPGQLIYSYDTYILYHLLDNIRKAPGVHTIHSEIILKLYEYDQQNNTELLPTFLCLCKYNFNSLQAAEEMYLHRNSLYKRMERISSVLGMDFDSVDNLIIFHLAAKLHALFS